MQNTPKLTYFPLFLTLKIAQNWCFLMIGFASKSPMLPLNVPPLIYRQCLQLSLIRDQCDVYQQTCLYIIVITCRYIYHENDCNIRASLYIISTVTLRLLYTIISIIVLYIQQPDTCLNSSIMPLNRSVSHQ